MTINKSILVQDILRHLANELSTLLYAAKQAHEDATDDQSVAETQYDTLAIEAGYLAEGQSKRALAIKNDITKLETLPLIDFNADISIKVSALVQLTEDKAKQHWFFILPVAGGYKGKFQGNTYTVISPLSPMGKALINKVKYDEVYLKLGAKVRHDEINHII